MENQHENPLGCEPINHLMARFAIPSIIAMLVSALYNMVDQFFIGHSVGMQGNAATNVAFPLTITCTAVSLLFGIGGAANFNLSMGRKKAEEAKHFIGNAIFLMLSFGICLCLVVCLFLNPLLKLFGATADILTYSQTYTSITAFGFPFLILSTGGSNLVRADGSPRFSMTCTLVGCLVNLILDPLFIFGFDMGMAGAAWATIISQALSALWAVWFLSKGKSILRLKKENLRIDMKVLAPCIALGVAPFAMQATESVLVLCFNSSLLRYGGDLAVGAMTILSSVMQFAMLPLQGLTQGGQPIISYNYGAMQAQRVKKAFRLQTIACFTYSSLLWAAVELCPSLFVAIFTNEPQLSEITVWALRIYMAAVLLMGIQVSCQQTFIAFGNSKISAFLAVFRKIIVLIPLIFILPQFMQDDVFAVFLAEPIADTIAVITTATLFAFEFKKVMRKMQEDAHPASA